MENHPLHDQFIAQANERSLLRELIAQYNVLMDNYELQPDNHSSKALKDFLDRFPTVPNYDEKGNWIGNVRNENGWTS